ncbi:MAG: polysaccharide deacetylase family protein [Solirubrobacteraceae bacterium]
MRSARDPWVVILGYHKIGISPGEWESWYYVPQPTLERHVELLVQSGWQPIAPDLLLAGLQDPGQLPQRSFLITFDDAYRSLRAQAVPWLVANRIPAVVFVPTSYVGGLNDFDRDVEPEEAILDWEDLQALRSDGVWIQSHGVSHRAFSELTAAERVAELRCSKAAIERRVGGTVNLLSYPYGDPGVQGLPYAEELCQAGYDAACGYGGGPFPVPSSDRFLLPRIAVGPDTDLEAEIAPRR